MAIYYLDIDDEITSAAQRIRESGDSRIALVVQSGSRLASSRINFKLLAREARHRNRRLAIVAADASVRSLAEAAGLPVFGTVGEYQKAEAARPAGDGESLGQAAARATIGRAGPDGRPGGAPRSGRARQSGALERVAGARRPAGPRKDGRREAPARASGRRLAGCWSRPWRPRAWAPTCFCRRPRSC